MVSAIKASMQLSGLLLTREAGRVEALLGFLFKASQPARQWTGVSDGGGGEMILVWVPGDLEATSAPHSQQPDCREITRLDWHC